MTHLYLLVASTSIVPNPLASWLSTHACGIGDRVTLSGDQVVTTQPVAAGETILELKSGACLTADAAYADREMGRDLQSIAARVGPGFETVAIAAYLAAERVREFQAESWYAGSAAEQVGVQSARRDSAWSALTLAHWETEVLQPSTIDPELASLVQQGIQLVFPLIELAARRAWVPGAAPAAPMFSDAWVRAAVTDDSAGWSRGELEGVLTKAFARVLSQQWAEPPPYFAHGTGHELRTEPAPQWGYGDDAPRGPALLPPFEGLFSGGGGSVGNCAVGVPPAPAASNLGQGVCVRCVAVRPLERGEVLVRCCAGAE